MQWASLALQSTRVEQQVIEDLRMTSLILVLFVIVLPAGFLIFLSLSLCLPLPDFHLRKFDSSIIEDVLERFLIHFLELVGELPLKLVSILGLDGDAIGTELVLDVVVLLCLFLIFLVRKAHCQERLLLTSDTELDQIFAHLLRTSTLLVVCLNDYGHMLLAVLLHVGNATELFEVLQVGYHRHLRVFLAS